MFAIIETGGKQIKVQEGDTVKFEKLVAENQTQISLDKILLVTDGEQIAVGNPYLEGASVSATKLRDEKAKKVIIYKFKRRKDSDKKQGHRQTYSLLKIDKINSSIKATNKPSSEESDKGESHGS